MTSTAFYEFPLLGRRKERIIPNQLYQALHNDNKHSCQIQRAMAEPTTRESCPSNT